MIRRLWLCVLALSLFTLGRAEAQEYRYELGLGVGAAYYVGDVSPNLWGRQAPSIAISLRHLLDLRWSLTTELGYRRLEGRVAREHTFPTGRTQKFSRGLWDLAFGGEFNFFPYSDKYRYLLTRSWTPYLGLGVGLALGKGSPTLLFTPSLYGVLGVKYKLSSRVGLSLSWVHRRTFTDRLEITSAEEEWMADPLRLNRTGNMKGHDSYGYWSLGVNISLSQSPQRGCN